jgi:TPR repeat protein
LLGGQGVEKDPAAALPWLEKAAEAGVPEAQERLGLAVFHGDLIEGVGRDDEKARRLLEAAAEAGQPAAQNAYAFMLASARGGSGDGKAAEQWYRRAAEQGDAKGMANLGRILFNTAAKDRARRVEGLKWLMMAQEMKEPTAKNTLNEYQVNIDGAEWSEAQKEADRGAYKLGFKAALAKQQKQKPTPAASPEASPAAPNGE